MKTKTISLLFVFVALMIGAAFFIFRKFFSEEKSLVRAKVITPTSSVHADGEEENDSVFFEGEGYETFVPIAAGETLISTYSMDINNDGYDDEVIAVRKQNSQFLYLIPSLLNPESGVYTRLQEIPTQFSRTTVFSYSGMDVIGDHKNSLIYQGVADDGNYIMKIFLYNENTSSLDLIGDFSSDGTVFIQQTERSENYELALSKGESYSVWVYKSDDSSAGSQNGNQLQMEYTWNEYSKKYELSREIKVTAGRLAATELSRIQDGTVETFANFLGGLWYKTSNEDEIRYIFFDYGSKEIIQLYGDVQEVFDWEDSKLRHNGIYITVINSDITNLHRRFDIALVNTDEIKITLRDDVNLVIKDANLWDGQYKKMNLQSSFERTFDAEKTVENANYLKQNGIWETSDQKYVIAFDEFTYTFQTPEFTDTGVFAVSKIGSSDVIQFRSDSRNTLLGESYEFKFGTKIVKETQGRRTVEKEVPDYDIVKFEPVRITPTECFSTDGTSWAFVRSITP